MNRLYLIFPLSVFIMVPCIAQGVLKGKIESVEGPSSFVNIGIYGSNMGTYSDENGDFILQNIPDGEHRIQFSSVGFKSQDKVLQFSSGDEQYVHIELEKTYEELEEVVVTGSRTEQKKTESPVIVGVIDKNTLVSVHANSLADGLNYQSGLRMETDCQTCGYSQLRMNGLGGAYSMILIDGTPIFSSLIGLYGLEMIPTDMIERIEIVRGGGSAIYGSNAIAGTVNVITKEPSSDYFNISATGGIIDRQSFEQHMNASVSKVLNNAGLTLHVNTNNREAYDANKDGFSELPMLKGINFGSNAFYKTGKYSTLGFNINGINEYRRGGNKIDEAAHKADQSEERNHDILMGSINFKSSFPNINSSTRIYFAGQHTKRKHYTGIDHADAYGNTFGYTIMGGFQYNFYSKAHTITLGTEYLQDYVNDEIKLYDYTVDQKTGQFGFFIQDDWKINPKISLLAGLRLDKHNIIDNLIVNPRINLLYKPFDFTQVRASYSSGYRAPQAFDADLHIAFAGGGVSIIQLDSELEQENSESYSLSINYDRPTERYIYGFTLDAFHSRLHNAFVLEDNGFDEQGNMSLLKKNGGGSTVQGITFEGRMNYNKYIEINFGLTFQKSQFSEPVQWSSEIEGTIEYLRTPNDYGYYLLDINPTERMGISFSGVYTGSMLIPHYGGAPGVPSDQIITSKTFFDQNIKLSYEIPIKFIKYGIEFFGGVKNIFNAYQNDFDMGRYRDSNFVYGPARPRSIYLGIKVAPQR